MKEKKIMTHESRGVSINFETQVQELKLQKKIKKENPT